MTDATEAPAPPSLTEPAETDPGQSDANQIEAAVAAFRRQLDGQVSVPASVVQDCLLDLWGSLPEGDSRSEVETTIKIRSACLGDISVAFRSAKGLFSVAFRSAKDSIMR